MPGRLTYNLLYLKRTAWDLGPRAELVELVNGGVLTPERLAPGRAVDLGSGIGDNTIFLAEHGFEATGIDFSTVALARARRRAEQRGVAHRVRFVQGDLKADRIPSADGPFDLLVSYGTLEDFWAPERKEIAATVKRLSRAGSKFLLWCFYSAPDALPRFSVRGPSRTFPLALFPGEEEELFGDVFDIERYPVRSPRPAPHVGAACFVMTRR